MAFQFSLSFTTEPSTENLADRFIYAFTSDAKIIDSIASLVDTLKTVKDSDFESIVPTVPVIGYSRLKRMLDVNEFFVDNTKELFDAISAKKDKDEIATMLRDFEKELFSKFPKDKVLDVGAYTHESEYKGKTLKELGYTKSNLSSAIKKVSETITQQKELIKKMKKYSGFFASIKYGKSVAMRTSGFSLYLTKFVPKAYTFMKRMFFHISKKLQKSGE